MPELSKRSLKDRAICLPVNSFGMAMGLSGLAIAWQLLARQYVHVGGFSLIIGALATASFVYLLAITAIRWLSNLGRLNQEWQHPIKLNFFPAISIAMLLQSVFWFHSQPQLAAVLWMVGAVLQLTLTVLVVSRWIVRRQFTLDYSIPVRFIPAVGNIIVPITGAMLGYKTISWAYFILGLVFWVLLFGMVYVRLRKRMPVAEHLIPTFFILLAPPSVGFVAYTQLVGELDIFARIIYAIAFLILLILLFKARMFARLPFALSSWAFSFPLAAFTIANFRMAVLTQMPMWGWIAIFMLLCCSIIVGWLLIKTIRAYWCGTFCSPELSGSP